MPIELLHFADLHLGVENYGRINPETGLHTRFEDFVRTLNGVVDDAVRREIDLVVFAGDAYKNRDPSPTHQRAFAAALRRLSSADIPTVVLVGNHDVPNTRGRAHAIEVFRVLDVPHVYVADRPRIIPVPTRHGNVQVVSLPYRRASLLREGEDLRTKSADEVGEAVVRSYREFLEGAAADLDPAQPTVLAGHLHVAGAVAGSERAMMLADEPMVSLSVLVRPELNLDYVALGHMHGHQDLNRHGYPAVVYSGSLERVDFGEESDTKGYVIVHLERGNTSYEFVPVNARRFVTVECDLGGEDPMAALEQAVASAGVADAVVRLRYTVPEQQRLQVSAADVHRVLKPSYYVGRMERQVVRPDVRQRDPHLTDSLDAYTALVRDPWKTRPPRSPLADVLDYGQRLIQELDATGSQL